MGNTNTFQKARLAVFRLSGMQLVLTAVLTGIALLVFGWITAQAVLLGGSIGVIAGFYQAQRMMSVNAGNDPQAFMRSLWISELVKVVLTVVMFIAAFRLIEPPLVPTIVGYAGTYTIYWVALGTSYPWFETSVTNNLRDRNWPDNLSADSSGQAESNQGSSE